MRKSSLSKKVLAIVLAAALFICCLPAMSAFADFTSVNLLTGAGNKVDLSNSTPVYYDKYLTENVFASGYGLSASTVTGLVDGDKSTECLFNGRGTSSRWWNGVRYALTEACFAQKLVIYSGLPAYIDCYDVYASDSLETLYRVGNYMGKFTCSGDAVEIPLNKSVQYFAVIYDQITSDNESARPREVELWSGDEANTFAPVCLTDSTPSKLESYSSLAIVPATMATATYNIGADKLEYIATNTTSNSHKDISQSGSNYTTIQYGFDSMYYVGDICLDAGTWNYDETWDVYASNSLANLYTAGSKVATVECKYASGARVSVNTYATYIGLVQTTGYSRIRAIRIYTADGTGVPAPFVAENILATNVDSARCIQFYPTNHYVGDASQINAETIAKLTDGDTATTSDCSTALDWDPPRYLGVEYALDSSYYIGELKIYSGYTTSVDTFDVYASDSFDTLYSDDNLVASGVNCDGTAAQTLAVNRNITYVAFLISGIELYCARIAEFEAWTADPSAVFVTENALITKLASVAGKVQFTTTGTVNDVNLIDSSLAMFTDGDTATHADLNGTLDWDPPRRIGAEFTLTESTYIGTIKLYASIGSSYPESYRVYASNSSADLYTDAKMLVSDESTTGDVVEIQVNESIQYIAFFCDSYTGNPRFKEIEAWTADPSATPVDDGITRVLTIGNSFAENASIYASEIAYANGKQMIFGYLKYPSCTLERHWNDVSNNTAEFKFRVTDVTGTGTTVADGSSTFYSIQQAIDYADWDIVVFQQESSNARNYSTFAPYLQNLIDYVEGELPSARLLFHQVWRWGEWDADQFDLIKEASERMVKDYGLELIPSGLAFEYAREALGSATIINEDDGHYQHANRYGQYIEGCCYVAKIFDIEIAADTFASHPYVNDENFVATLTAAANNAVSYYNKAVGDADENGTIEGNDLTKIRKHLVDGAEIRKDIGDVTGNYEIDVYDYVHLKSYLLDTANVELR